MGNALRITVLAAVLATALAGCGMSREQKAAVSAFAGSAETFGTAATAALPEIRDSVLELRNMSRSLPGAGSDRNFRAFKDADGFRFRPDEGGFVRPDIVFDKDAYAARLKLAQLLKGYGTALSELMTVGNLDAVKPVFASLGTSLQAIPDLSDAAKKSIGGVTAAAGPVTAIAADAERLGYLREIVARFDPAIQEALGLIARDYELVPSSQGGGLSLNVLGQYETAINATGFIVEEASRTASTAQERASTIATAAAVARHKARKDALGKSLPEAAAAMGKAHAAMLNALNGRDFSLETIRQFAGEAEVVYALITAF